MTGRFMFTIQLLLILSMIILPGLLFLVAFVWRHWITYRQGVIYTLRWLIFVVATNGVIAAVDGYWLVAVGYIPLAYLCVWFHNLVISKTKEESGFAVLP